MTYYVRACWDAEAGVFTSESNIPGLVVEAETVDEFMEIAQELAPAMLRENVAGNPTVRAVKAELDFVAA